MSIKTWAHWVWKSEIGSRPLVMLHAEALFGLRRHGTRWGCGSRWGRNERADMNIYDHRLQRPCNVRELMNRKDDRKGHEPESLLNDVYVCTPTSGSNIYTLKCMSVWRSKEICPWGMRNDRHWFLLQIWHFFVDYGVVLAQLGEWFFEQYWLQVHVIMQKSWFTRLTHPIHREIASCLIGPFHSFPRWIWILNLAFAS